VKTITADQLLEQIELGAEVHPSESPFEIGLRVGRWNCVCNLEDLTWAQRADLERLYLAGELRFAHPGDFLVAPFFFHQPLRTQRTSFGCRRLHYSEAHAADGSAPPVTRIRPIERSDETYLQRY
jgi:hypothetical protein